jgi:hypothetical protein
VVRVQPVKSGADLDRFVKLPFYLHSNDPNWVPPLTADARRCGKLHQTYRVYQSPA